MTKPGSGIKVISFFSGAGGLDLGFHNAGFDVVWANEIVPLFCRTLEANKGGLLSPQLEVCCKDIRQIVPDELPKDVDLVIGGPPCQSFSASGRRAGGAPGRLDERGNLFQAYCRLIQSVQPRAFLFENVRGILATNKGKDWADIVDAFSNIGYRVSYRVLDASDYGVPQQRERMFLVGHKLDGEFLFPEPLYGPDSSSGRPHLTPRQVLEGVCEDEDTEPLILRGGKYGTLLTEIPPGENYLHFTAKRGHPKPIFAYRSRFSDFLYKANPDATIKTLIASPGKYTGPFHWDSRLFTIAEYKRLQSFPDDYLFCGNRGETVRQIGNSVCPKIAEIMALALAKQVFNKEVDIALIPADRKLSFDKKKGQKASKTRERHEKVISDSDEAGGNAFAFSDYTGIVGPSSNDLGTPNVTCRVKGRHVELRAEHDISGQLFARVQIEINPSEQLALFSTVNSTLVDACVYGNEPQAIQTLWNAFDDLVIRSSSFHSLFEIYGHFTEPHPAFRVCRFDAPTCHPVAKFAQYFSQFSNCSRYFDRSHLVTMFGNDFGSEDFVEIVKMLRLYRFDIRCSETNIAIPDDVYMVAYPFTLPFGKLMSFGVREDKER